jgi:hypothetical protein
VTSVNESVTLTAFPAASCTNTCLKIGESTPLAPDDIESKFYSPGYGLVRTIEPDGEHTDLVGIVGP